MPQWSCSLARNVVAKVRESADCFTKVREVSRKFAQIRPVIPRFLAPQARHKLDAPVELFAGAKRGRESARKCGLFHESPRSFTKVRTDQARNSAIFGFPSPPQVRCPSGVVRWRETWSRKCAKVRIVSRKSAKFHESPHRSG